MIGSGNRLCLKCVRYVVLYQLGTATDAGWLLLAHSREIGDEEFNMSVCDDDL